MTIVTGLYYYPIKSCGSIAADKLEIGLRGFCYDRHWMLVDPSGRFLTQRELRHMALIQPTLVEGCMLVQAPDMPPLEIPINQPGETIYVDIWRDSGIKAVDHGSTIAQWFSEFLKFECRLVRLADDGVRQVNQRYAKRETDQVAFSDGYPFLLLSEESLADLNDRLDEPLPMNRFRPNIVIRGVEAYAEDRWKIVRIGEVTFDAVKLSERCAIITTNQETAERGKEPLRTLSMYRKFDDGSPKFGQNMVHHHQGVIRVGDSVEVLE